MVGRRPFQMMRRVLWAGIFLISCLSTAPSVQAFSLSYARGVDPLALARAHHYYNRMQYDKALEILAGIAESTNYHPEILAIMSRLTSQVKTQEQETEKRARQDQEYLGSVQLAVSNLGFDLGEKPYSDEPRTRVTQRTSYTYTGLSGLPTDSHNKTASEYITMETQAGEYKIDSSIHYQYLNGADDNDRIRHLNYRIKGPIGTINLGDSSVHYSRYVLNGLDYTGVSAKLNLPYSDLELLYGKTPRFKTDSGDEKYIYPRDVFGIRHEFKPTQNWKAGQSYAYMRDAPSRVEEFATFGAGREKNVVGIDNEIDVIPGLLDLHHESVFAYVDPDIEADTEKLKDFAHYVKMELGMRHLKILSLVEYIGPDFDSAGGFNVSAQSQNSISNDRVHFENSITYTPRRWLYTNLQWSRTRNKLQEAVSFLPTTTGIFVYELTPEHTRQDWLQANMRLDLPGKLPRFGMRLTEVETFSSPGSADFSNDSITRQLHFELSKYLYSTHLNLRYETETFEDRSGDFDDELRHRVGFTASRTLFNRIGLLGGYAYLRKDAKNPPSGNDTRRLLEDHEWNFSVSGALKWGLTGTLGYTFNDNSDWTLTDSDKQAHRLNASLSWPWTGTLFGAHKVTLHPFVSLYKDLSTDPGFDRDAWSAKLEAEFEVTPDAAITLSADYRNDNTNGGALNGTGEDFRVLMNFHTEFGEDPAEIPEPWDTEYRGAWDEHAAGTSK